MIIQPRTVIIDLDDLTLIRKALKNELAGIGPGPDDEKVRLADLIGGMEEVLGAAATLKFEICT